MGTSKDYGGSTGGGWTGFKRAATRLATGDGGNRAIGSVAGRYVEALGGPTAAAASARAGARATGGIARLLSGIDSEGFTPTLQELGLGDYVGSTPLELIAALSEAVAGDGATLEEAAALEAAVWLIEDLFGDATTFEEVDSLALDQAGVRDRLGRFIARYVYLRLLPLLDERLVQRGDPAAAARLERQVWEYTLALTQDQLADVDVVGLDWRGPDAEVLATDLIRGVYEVFGE